MQEIYYSHTGHLHQQRREFFLFRIQYYCSLNIVQFFKRKVTNFLVFVILVLQKRQNDKYWILLAFSFKNYDIFSERMFYRQHFKKFKRLFLKLFFVKQVALMSNWTWSNWIYVQMSNWIYVRCPYGPVQFQQYPFGCFIQLDICPIGPGPNVQLYQLDPVQFQHCQCFYL